MGRPAAIVVENQPFVGLVASDILHECGFETFHAHDAGSSFELLNAHQQVRLIVTDADLSGSINGLDLARQVSTDRPDIQLIVTTASRAVTLPEVPDGVRMLHKPYASGELRMLVAPSALLQDA